MKEQTEINKNLCSIYQKLFSKNKKIFFRENVSHHLKDKNLPKLKVSLCEKDIATEEVKHEYNKMKNNKSPRNEGLTKKKFYEAFWDHVKVLLLLLSFKMAFLRKELCTSLKQAVIKLIKKNDREKRFTKDWRPISLLNVEVKFISKVLSNRIKKLLPNLKRDRLISDFIEIPNILNMEDYLLTIGIDEALTPLAPTFYLLF